MFLRCAKGSVCDVELLLSQLLATSVGAKRLLDQVEDTHAVAHGREQARAIWGEDKIASAVDGAQQIGELSPWSAKPRGESARCSPGSRSSWCRVTAARRRYRMAAAGCTMHRELFSTWSSGRA
jgi:hypothetical protein